MYYAWYYAPNFRARFPGYATVQLLEKSAMEKWSLELSRFIRSNSHWPLEEPVAIGSHTVVPLVPVSDRTLLSPEFITLSKAAVQGDTLIWTLVGLAGAVYSCLPDDLAVFSVLALAFSLSIDPDAHGSSSIHYSVYHLFLMFYESHTNGLNSRDTPTPATVSKFENCRYNPKSALGKRLQEDVRLWLKVAAHAGILNSSGEQESVHRAAEIADTLRKLLQQSWPWFARVLPGYHYRMVFQRNGCLCMGSEAESDIRFLRQLQAVGMNIDVHDMVTTNIISYDS